MGSSREKSEAEDDPFEHLTAPVESVQHYVPGGLHPVYLGDIVGDGRYKILRKLGYGGYSTVWLAQDCSGNGSFVALKVVRADSACTKEIQIHDTLRAKADQHPGSSCIMILRDHFSILGPNGNHVCLAYEVLGASVASVREESAVLNTYLTLPCARRIVHRVLLGLDYMHSIGLVHGDLYAANVLFTVKDLSQEPMDILCQPYDHVSVDVKRINGPRQPGDPRHLSLNRPLNRFLSPDGNVKLSDLGNSFFENDPPDNRETPAEIRSPEMILDGHVSMAQDCWAFGCLVYNVFTNGYPFELAYIYNKDSRDDAHLLQLSSLLGPLPAKLKNSWLRYGTYFDDEGQLKKFDVDDDTFSYSELDNLPKQHFLGTTTDTMNDGLEEKAGETPSTTTLDHLPKSEELFEIALYPSIVKTFEGNLYKDQPSPESLAEYNSLNPPLRERWLNKKHPDMELEEAELVLDFLQGLLTYDPNERLSTKALLRHAWIRDYCVPDDEPGTVPEKPATGRRNKRKRSNADEESQQKAKKGVHQGFSEDVAV